ncbi:ABC transporter substrate-binding protein [Maritimibacter sp. DP07]|uniref:ABC transporter substrate-binding protein n=1 Tax=Maritimibacter harenae TaxID=2606218 RepID=A0A845M0T9_9RHOB|nr:amino acid ABC transporter substrate-binding protein [Maritimibacter harenae]MZR13655.1 ABC transporter substrate-binding protein [Maritimibacter harenae]
MKRRTLLKATTTLAASLVAGVAMAADPIIVGAVAPKTGPLAGGAAVTHWPNIELWVSEVNERGGLNLGGEQRMLEVIEYDDQTNPAETIKAVQRLATQDDADIILAPYSTGLNLAAAPIFDKLGFPQITSSAATDQIEELSSQFEDMFFLLGRSTDLAEDAVEVLSDLREAGEIGNSVAMVNVADAFGIELAAVGKPALEAAGFDIVYETSYPLGTQDLSPIMKAAKAAEPDAFVAWSYPPDTFGLTEQAMIEELDVKAFYTAVATAFPSYGARFGSAAEGVMGIGGVNTASPDFQDYAARLEATTGSKPDYWASGMMYASLQILEEAIETTGTLDMAEVTQFIKDNSFETVMGTIEFDDQNNNTAYWTVGQWQDGEFKGIKETGREGAVEPIIKSGWE